MKLYICLNFMILVIYVWLTNGAPQDFEDPTQFFKLIEFDQKHRGSFNNTNCIRDLLNCWEVIKMDLVCSKFLTYDSVCGIVYIECNDNTGMQEWGGIDLHENFCKD